MLGGEAVTPVDGKAGEQFSQVEASSLEMKTSAGWVLVGVLQTSWEDPVFRSRLHEGDHVVTTRPVYLVKREPHERITELTDDVARLADERTQAREEANRARADLQGLRSSLLASQADVVRLANDQRATATRVASLQSNLQKAETDLAKVREAIGSKEWNRIVGEESKKP